MKPKLAWPLFLLLVLALAWCGRDGVRVHASSVTPACSLKAVCQAPPVTITTSNLLNGDTVTLVPAPGANKIITGVQILYKYTFGTRPFGRPYGPGTALCNNPTSLALNINLNTIPQGTMLILPCGSAGEIDPSNINQPLTSVNSQGPVPGGAASSAIVGAGGLLYAVNDTGTVSDCGDGNADYTVNSVGAGGVVVTVTITAGGAGYTTQTGCGTTVATGAGNGALSLNITALNGDGSITATAIYTVVAVP